MILDHVGVYEARTILPAWGREGGRREGGGRKGGRGEREGREGCEGKRGGGEKEVGRFKLIPPP